MPFLKPFLTSAAFAALLTSLAAPATAGCDTAPSAQDDTAETLSDPIVIDVLANDFDPDGGPLGVSVTAMTCTGSTSVDRGLVTFAPASALGSPCTIDYQVTDAGGDTATATITVSPAAPPPPPPPPPTPIFQDGFETGNTNAWSAVGPLKNF